ncbi:cyclophilin-like fold protein [Enterocloster bolteae]|uniref:cyclophilin-like fold protein n=1 Tax=Enterocloster bolteae TaxID=208479 RepID=UPI0028DBD4E0|nr:cyclophilin-like fold protein [Enterocloster bolteae]
MKKILICMLLAVFVAALAGCGNKMAGSSEQITDINAGVSEDAETVTGQDTQNQETGDSETAAEESTEKKPETESTDSQTDQTEGNSMKITAGDTTFTVALADNSSVDALRELLAEGPLTIDMNDYGNMEKVGPIGTSLPRNDEQITTGAGDVILYQGDSLVIYYDTNSWNFTRIGKIDGVTKEELLDAFGSGSVTVTFTLE